MKIEVKRFIKSINSKISIADEEFIRKYLNQQEQILFYRQRIADQRHSLDVSYYIIQNTMSINWINKDLIIKSALLHDIGKSYVFMPLWIRPIAVVMKRYTYKIYRTLYIKGKKPNARNFFKYFYAYEFHPEIAEKMLTEIGVESQVVKLISMHHEPPSNREPKELPLFRRADNLA